MIGAISRLSVVSTSYSVAYAARLSASSSPFQKRRRLRRTYQFDRSSTNASIARVARMRVVPVERGAHLADQRVEARQDPSVQQGAGAVDAIGLVRRPAVEARVGDEEAVRVPQRQEEAAHDLVGRPVAEVAGSSAGLAAAYIQRMTSAPICSAASSNGIELPLLLCISSPCSSRSSA